MASVVRYFTWTLLFGALLSACSGGASSGGDARGDGGNVAASDGAAGQGTGDAAAPTDGMCNILVNRAPVVYVTKVASALPTPQGGVPMSGTYYLTTWNLYTGPDGGAGPGDLALQETDQLTVSGNTVTIQIVQNDGPDTAEVHQTMLLSISGTIAAGRYTCPFTGMGQLGITVTTGGYRLLFGTPDGPEEYVYTRH